MIQLQFRKAITADIPEIWKILQSAISRRKEEGSNQWQDGYPNQEQIEKDISSSAGYVLESENKVAAYVAVFINDEPEYQNIKGKWLTEDDFVVFHRVAVSEEFLGKGLAQRLFQEIETFAGNHKIKSIKADTNFDNLPMLYLFKKNGYQYCGEVFFRGSPRQAFEKILV